MEESTCLQCGAMFHKTVDTQVYCSIKCRKKADKKRNPSKKHICSICGNPFKDNHTESKRCPSCREIWHAECSAKEAEKQARIAEKKAADAAIFEVREWRPLEDYPPYLVSEDGLIYNPEKSLVLKFKEDHGHQAVAIGPKDSRRVVSREWLARAFTTGSIESSKLPQEERSSRAVAGARPFYKAKSAATSERVLAAWNSGLNAKQIRETLNLGENTVMRHLHAAGIFPQKIIEEKAQEKKKVKKPVHWPTLNERGKAWTDITGAEYQDLSALEIYARDNYTCYICGSHLSRAGGKNAPLYPTVDHVIPLSAGGPHTYENTRACCRQCNVAKGTKPLEEVTCCA